MNLTNTAANDGWARWAPDGDTSCFTRNRDGNFELYVMNRDGDDLMRLTNYPGVDQFPEWSPNGREIAFRRDIDVHVLDLESGEIRRLTNAPPLNQMPSWSPNGKQLAFMSIARRLRLRVRDERRRQRSDKPDAEGPRRRGQRLDQPGAFLVNHGRQIYFMSSRPSTGLDTEIFIMNLDGTGTTRITDSIGMDGSPRPR